MIRMLFAYAFLLFSFSSALAGEPVTLLNVSYDPTREFYTAYNQDFIKYWKEKTGEEIKIVQSHGGSGKQARSVIDGLKADVVTLALAYDIDAIAGKAKLLPANWQAKLPYNSCPYSSAIVLLVRKGNPKGIKDWNDLIRPDVQVLTPNPKTSGGARWNYLAAWGYAMSANNQNEEEAKKFISKLFHQTSVLDSGARGATTNFVKRGLGDVLITWENEALLLTRDLEKDKFEIVMPSLTVLAEPPVAVIEENARKKGTEKIALEYLEHLYSTSSQELLGKFYYRPVEEEIVKKYSDLFVPAKFMMIADFGGWKAANEKHFADGGIFDQIYSR